MGQENGYESFCNFVMSLFTTCNCNNTSHK